MGLYFIVFLASFVIACLSVRARNNKYLDKYTSSLYIIITLMLCLRFGQGTDYFTYRTMFYVPWHGEPLYLFLCYIFSRFTDFSIFIAVISLAEMIMLWGFIRKRSPNRAVSVMLLMTVIYVTYLCNLVRQGLALSIFLRFGIDLIERREWKKYMILCTLTAMIHTVSVVYFLVPVVMKLKARGIAWSIPLCAIISTMVLRRFGSGIIPYFGSHPTRYVAAAERMMSFIIIYMVYNNMRHKTVDNWIIKLYCLGTALYFLFLPFSLVASRVAICFKALEIVIVPSLIMERSRYRKILMYYFFALSVVMFVHNLGAEIDNGGYRKGINAVNFPYVSVFNANDIYNYRRTN